MLWTNCARAESRLVQVGSTGWKRLMMVLLIDLWWSSWLFSSLLRLGRRKNVYSGM